jgi:hypothetical protein
MGYSGILARGASGMSDRVERNTHGTSSTRARIARAAFDLRRRPRPLPPRSRFICQACSERPSTPCARAHSPAFNPERLAADRHRRASFSSSIFVPAATRDLLVATEPARLPPRKSSRLRRLVTLDRRAHRCFRITDSVVSCVANAVAHTTIALLHLA